MSTSMKAKDAELFKVRAAEKLGLPRGATNAQILAAADAVLTAPAPQPVASTAPNHTIPEMLEATAWGGNDAAAAELKHLTTPPKDRRTAEALAAVAWSEDVN